MAKKSGKHGKRNRKSQKQARGSVAARPPVAARYEPPAGAGRLPVRSAVTQARVASPPAHTSDDRFTLGLMLAPVLLVAFVLASGKVMKPRLDMIALPEVIALRWPVPAARTPASIGTTDIRSPLTIAYRPVPPRLGSGTVAVAAPRTADRLGSPALARPPVFDAAIRASPAPPVVTSAPAPDIGRAVPAYRTAAPGPFGGLAVRDAAPDYAAVVASGPRPAGEFTVLPAALTPRDAAAPLLVKVALVRPEAVIGTGAAWPPVLVPAPVAPPGVVPDLPGPPAVPPLSAAGIADQPRIDGGVCRPERVAALTPDRRPPQLAGRTGLHPDRFGLALARAAEAQSDDLVFYTANYRRVAYPRGDIAAMHGSCSDVVIRAFRSLGIDLQEHVQRARVGSGDTNIDHRRTETLRKLFDKLGASLPVTAFPENYRPGDIVTYHRPHSRVSRAHIAIVSDRLAATGRPMVIHNRGWGVQLEDALFADAITGHYRLNDAMVPPEAASTLIAGSPRQTTASGRVAGPKSARKSRTSEINSLSVLPGGKKTRF